MPLRTLSALLIVLLLTTVASEARRRPRSSGSSYGAGGLARERGLSRAESQAAGTVLAETASGAGSAAEIAALPARRYSPDYYRVYHQRIQAAAVKKPAPANPAPAPVPVRVTAPPPTPAPLPRRIFMAAPKVKPTPPPQPLARRMVVVALPPSKPLRIAPRPAQRQPLRVAVMPQDASGTIYLPVNRRAAATPAPTTKLPAPGIRPKRSLFR